MHIACFDTYLVSSISFGTWVLYTVLVLGTSSVVFLGTQSGIDTARSLNCTCNNTYFATAHFLAPAA